MKIVYFGSDVFLKVFQHLLFNHEMLALYTYRKEEDYFCERNVVALARLHRIPVYYTRITEDRMAEYMDGTGCELFFVAEYSHKIPVPETSRFRGVNIHASLLPSGRSYYPIECAMERGVEETGVSIHKITPKIDSGDILAQRRFPITPDEDSVDVYLKCAAAAHDMTREVMGDFWRYWNGAAPQTRTLPYWKRPENGIMTLRHDMTIAEAKNVYRKYNKLTGVIVNGLFFNVNELATGLYKIGADDDDIIFVRESKILYGVVDGHLRLCISSDGREV
jgi:methionyl-tRNA formyltransferase